MTTTPDSAILQLNQSNLNNSVPPDAEGPVIQIPVDWVSDADEQELVRRAERVHGSAATSYAAHLQSVRQRPFYVGPMATVPLQYASESQCLRWYLAALTVEGGKAELLGPLECKLPKLVPSVIMLTLNCDRDPDIDGAIWTIVEELGNQDLLAWIEAEGLAPNSLSAA